MKYHLLSQCLHLPSSVLAQGRKKLLVLSLMLSPNLGLADSGTQRPLSLQEAIELALTHSLAVKGAKADLEGQNAKTTASWLSLGPQVQAQYNAVYFNDKQSVQMGPQEIVMREKELKNGSLILAQPITGLFALHQRARFEEGQAELKQLNVEDAYRKTAFSTAELYLNAQRAEKQLDMVRGRIEAVKSQVRDGEALVQAGRLLRGDFLKLQLALSQAQSELARAVAMRDIARFSLLETTGLGATTGAAIPALALPSTPPAANLPSVDAALSEALGRRLELGQAEKRREAAGYGVKLAYARFSPEINLFAKMDRNFGKVTFGGEESTRSYGIELKWHLWDNGARFYQVREAAAQEAGAGAAVDGARQQIRIEVVTVLANLKASQQSYELANVANEQALEAYRIEKAKFSSGKSTATELILSESAAATASTGLLAAYTELRIQNFKLQQALGARSPQL